ncbi:Panacea domain-containing protein [Devosia ginsengisoli]|uniref:Panacea domain-containing protein n=1 Tax=Devosia ginsengisoli TaxID=400770 RepID=UPI0026F1358B|nr:type II toxin-antitoxin system antitoxin SocA domain-containing protein [Devosia ginsengisoli]MCR6670337.1 DUF4065 domain-containing protein [Devosia ginsengisoli]
MTDTPTYLYKPAWVANSFLVRAKDENDYIDPLKIQKLVYNLHGWHLATTGMPAVGERFEAWPKGPVLSSLYHRFKQYRWDPIARLAADINPTTGQFEAVTVPASDEQFQRIFDLVWNRYKGLNGTQLSALTHADGTPWTRARSAQLEYIPDAWIRDHFVEIASRDAAPA